MQPVELEIYDDDRGEVAREMMAAAFSYEWHRLSNLTKRSVVGFVALLLFLPAFVFEWRDESTLWTLSIQFAAAALTGCWAAASRRTSLFQALTAVLATLLLGAILGVHSGREFGETTFLFAPTTGFTFAAFALLRHFGWRLRRATTAEHATASMQFSVKHLLLATAGIAVAIVAIQQLRGAIDSRNDEFWGPLAMGLATAVGFVITAWAFLGMGRLGPRVLLSVIAMQALCLIALSTLQVRNAQGFLIVSGWTAAYYLFAAMPLATIRSNGYRYTRETARNPSTISAARLDEQPDRALSG